MRTEPGPEMPSISQVMDQSGLMHHTAAYQVENSANRSRRNTGTSQHPAGDPTSSLSRGDTGFHQQQVIQGTHHKAIVDVDGETESIPDVSGCPVLSPSLSAEARNRNATFRVCIVKSSWSPHGLIRLQGLDHPIRALEIKEGQEGFVLGDGMNDDAGNTWMIYVRARSTNANDKGWVMQNLLDIGQEAGDVKRTPLLEKELKHASFTLHEITPDEETGPIRIFHCNPQKVLVVPGNDDSRRGRILLIAGEKDARGEVYLSGISTDIPLGTTVFVVVEIHMGMNKRHPIPYARLPEPGPFSGWEDLNRIGS